MSTKKRHMLIWVLLLFPMWMHGGTNVLTRSYNNARTGANT